eukprot:441714-Prorocentrum_lima.AAC.1
MSKREGPQGKKGDPTAASAEWDDDQENPDSWYQHEWDEDSEGPGEPEDYQDQQDQYGYGKEQEDDGS